MVASTDIKFYVHTNNNAPQLTNNFGCMIDVLDACLVNGFGAQSVSTFKAVGKVVTVTFSTAHNLMQHQVIRITGANQSEFNGEFRILSVPDANTLTFELVNNATVAQASGTIVCSLPPLGWEKPFGSTHASGVGGKAAYRSTNLLIQNRPFLRVVDELDPTWSNTYSKYAKVGMIDNLTNIDDLSGNQAPYDKSSTEKNWIGSEGYNGWAKWFYQYNQNGISNNDRVNGSGVARWILVGCANYFYILPAPYQANFDCMVYGFGAYESYIDEIPFQAFLASSFQYSASGTSYSKGGCNAIGNNFFSQSKRYLLIDKDIYLNTYDTARCQSWQGVSESTNRWSGSLDSIAASSIGKKSFFSEMKIIDSQNCLRGCLNGIYYLHQLKPYTDMQFIVEESAIYLAKSTELSDKGQVVLRIA